MELSAELVFVIGLAASVIVWGVKLAAKNGATIPDAYLTGGVYVAAGLLAFLFAPVTLPAFPVFVDLATFVPALIVYVGALLVPLSAFVGFAGLVYQALLKRVLDGLAVKLAAVLLK